MSYNIHVIYSRPLFPFLTNLGFNGGGGDKGKSLLLLSLICTLNLKSQEMKTRKMFRSLKYEIYFSLKREITIRFFFLGVKVFLSGLMDRGKETDFLGSNLDLT